MREGFLPPGFVIILLLHSYILLVYNNNTLPIFECKLSSVIASAYSFL
jgi:hypothetical protein